MKNLVLVTTLMFSLSSMAAGNSVAERIDKAVKLLASTGDGGSQSFVTKTKGDAAKMLLELSLQQGYAESEADYQDRYKTDGSAWEADSGNIGSETLSGAESYVVGAIETRYLESADAQQDKIKFAESYKAAKQALGVLRSIKSVKFGVVPSGAVQCGVTLPSLLILDTENGRAATVSMEGSGC